MNKTYCIIFNTNDEILMLKNGNEYSLPSISRNTTNKKEHLTKYLYDNFGLSVKKSYLIPKESYENEKYFLCEEPYGIDEFNPDEKIKRQIIWISKRDLKDILLSNHKNKFSNTLIDALTKILGSGFSFSNKERNSLLKEMEVASNNGNTLYFNYLSSKSMYLITSDKQKLEENDHEYSLELIRLLCKNITLLHNKKLSEYKEKLKSTRLSDLTEKEASLIGMHDKWAKLFKSVFDKTSKFLPAIPTCRCINYVDEEIKFQNKDGITPSMMVSLYKRYKNKSYKEVHDDILKRRKEYKKK